MSPQMSTGQSFSPHRLVTQFLHAIKRTNKFILFVFLLTTFLWLFTYTQYGNGFVDSFQGAQQYSSTLVNIKTPPQTFKQQEIQANDVVGHLRTTEQLDERQVIFTDELNPDDGLELLDFDRSKIKYIYPEVIDTVYNLTDKDAVDWSRYAYVLYATSKPHMCNTLMIFAELRKFNTRAQLVVLVKQEFLTQPDEFPYEYKILTDFAKKYNVILKPTEVIQIGGDSVNIWLSSYTKLMVFNETEYDRIIYMDSDALLLKDNLDELFFLPPCKMAVSTAYWHTRRKFNEMGKDKIMQEYPPDAFGFKPMTVKKRANKITRFIKENILAYVDPSTKKLPVVSQDIESASVSNLKAQVNKKNFYTNLYNNLPSYPTLKEFDLTNIVMVIEPTAELFEKVIKAMAEKKKDEYDMELVQYHLFEFFDILSRQLQLSKEHFPNYPFAKRFTETPEFLILPHQVYGTISQQLNIEKSHFSYMADAHEQIFSHLHLPTESNKKAYYDIDGMTTAGDIMYNQMKYFHFSDAPIPKPWFFQKPHDGYMSRRRRCPTHRDFSSSEKGLVKPELKIDDCTAGEHWEQIHKTFKETRMDVCGLELVETDEDTYYKVIN